MDTPKEKVPEKTYTVFESRGQLKVTIPMVLAQAVGIKPGDKVKFVIDRGELVIKKA